jgi:hypothetical protein
VAHAGTPGAGAGVTNDLPTLVCVPAGRDPSIPTGQVSRFAPPKRPFEIRRGGHVANSNLGNGNLRPETLGETRRERSPERAKPTAETCSPRTSYGNVGLFLTLGSHVGCADFLVVDAVLRNWSPTLEFPANRENNWDSCLKMGFRLRFCLGFDINNNGLQENSLRTKTGN